jgi:hypothetical protein
MVGLAFRRSWVFLDPEIRASRVLDEFPICYTPIISTPPALPKNQASGGGE